MKPYIAAVIASLFALTYSQGPVDIKCVLKLCEREYDACLQDPMCVELTQCVGVCLKEWNEDVKTPNKLEVQNCTNICTYSYADSTFFELLTCMSEKQCIVLPQTPNLCKAASVKFQKNISLSDMAGTWWTLRGLNSAYDCYPCQKITFNATNVKLSFQAFTFGGGLKHFEGTGTVMENPPPQRGFNVSLPLGLINRGTYWPFDLVEDGGNRYVLVYYCASESYWDYDGAFVYSTATTISAIAEDTIRRSFSMNVGLNFYDFCSPSTTNCPE